MNADSFRKQFDVKMYCNVHPDTQLTFSSKSRVGASSAYEINVKILIHPCERCQLELNRIKEAAKILSSIE